MHTSHMHHAYMPTDTSACMPGSHAYMRTHAHARTLTHAHKHKYRHRCASIHPCTSPIPTFAYADVHVHSTYAYLHTRSHSHSHAHMSCNAYISGTRTHARTHTRCPKYAIVRKHHAYPRTASSTRMQRSCAQTRGSMHTAHALVRMHADYGCIDAVHMRSCRFTSYHSLLFTRMCTGTHGTSRTHHTHTRMTRAYMHATFCLAHTVEM